MSQRGVVQLSPLEWPPGRPFTNPRLIDDDRSVLIRLIEDLYATGAVAASANLGGRGRDRLILTRAGRENGVEPVTIVGFFGERRPDTPAAVVDAVELANAEMIDGFDAFPQLFGYVSRKLGDNFNYANLVVLAGKDGITSWRDLPDHTRAVVDLAPRYYASVRIYNGLLPQGLGAAGWLELHVVKYWDYSESGEWHAVRQLAFDRN